MSSMEIERGRAEYRRDREWPPRREILKLS